MKLLLRLLFFLLVAVLSVAFLSMFAPNPQPQESPITTSDLRVPIQNREGAHLEPVPQITKELPPAKKPAIPKKLPAVTVKPVTPPVKPPSPTTIMPGLTDQEFYTRFASSVIQIFCATQDQYFSASGVIVNERGLVITNAHVAEIVAKVGESHCQARHGNPASSFAGLTSVFIANTSAKIDDTEVPQHDFAFFKMVHPSESFTTATPTVAVARPGDLFLTLGYPSEFLESISATNNANLVFSLLTVHDLADIDNDPTTAEGYLFHGGIALQQGSSGTPLFTRSGEVAGLIFATTKATTTAERDGVALMTPYIDRELKKETGQGLVEFIQSH